MSIIINGDTGVSGVDGSASTPAYQGNDTNTGIFYPAADTIAFAEGGTEVMRITSTGGVNVGTYSADPGAGNMNVTGTVAMGSSFLRNRIINGDMQVWQRGTTFTGTVATPTPVQYGADRWFSSNNFNGGGAVIVMSQVSTGLQAVWSGTTAANGRLNIGQTIESLNCSDLWGKTVTIQAQVRAVGSMSICNIAVGFNTTNVAYVPGVGTSIGTSATASINTSAFTTITYTVTLPSAPSSTASLGILINPSRTSGTETTGDGIIINNVQLEIGTLATPFERRLYGQELANCQRYLPALNGINWTTTGYAYATNNGIGFITFPVTARTSPTGITVSSLSHFTVANSTNTLYTPTAIVIDVGNPAGTSIIWTTSTGLTAGTPTRMFASNAAAQLLFTGCEL